MRGTATDLDVFRAFVRAGQRLAEIHVHYEDQPEYPLTIVAINVETVRAVGSLPPLGLGQ